MAPRDYMERYPRLAAHLIYQSRGTLMPSEAAEVLKDAKEGRASGSRWIMCFCGGAPMLAVQVAIRDRHGHRRDAPNYETAQYVVQRFLETGEEPFFFIWFG